MEFRHWGLLRFWEREAPSRLNPVHPSAIPQDSLYEMGGSVTEFSDRLGISRSAVWRLMKGRCGIPPVVALALILSRALRESNVAERAGF